MCSVDEDLDGVRAGCLRVTLAALPGAEVVRFEANDSLACFRGPDVLVVFAGAMGTGDLRDNGGYVVYRSSM